MSRYSDWICRAVEPSADEVARVEDPLGGALREAARDATAPTTEEVHRVLLSRARVRAQLEAELIAQHEGRSSSRKVVLGAAALVAVAALALVAVKTTPPAYGDVALSIGEVHQLSSSTVLELGPAIDLSATGHLRIDQADHRGTLVTLLEGSASFDVEAEADFRHLVVRAGDTEVEVKGTRFEVALVDGEVGVQVEHGLVEVRHGGQAFYLSSGQRWREPAAEASAEVARRADPVSRGVVEATVEGIEQPRRPAEPSVPAGSTPDSAPAHLGTEQRSPEQTVATSPPLNTMTWKRASRQANNVLANRSADRTELLAALQMVNEVLDKRGMSQAEREQAMGLRLVLLTRAGGQSTTAGLITDISNYLVKYPSTDLKVELIRGRAEVAYGALGNKDLALQSYRELTALTSGADFAHAKAWQGILAHQLGDEREAAAALQIALESGEIEQGGLLREAQATCLQIRRCSVPR